MKNVITVIALLLSAVSLQASVPGVDRGMALERKSKIKNLTYNVFFDIPESPDSKTGGRTVIGFDYAPVSGDTLEIDFRGDASQLQSMLVNGRRCEPDYQNEHILIPDMGLERGHNEIAIEFTAGTRSLNRRDDFLYTLFVPDRARTTFPVFDQPDMKRATLSRLTSLHSGRLWRIVPWLMRHSQVTVSGWFSSPPNS